MCLHSLHLVHGARISIQGIDQLVRITTARYRSADVCDYRSADVSYYRPADTLYRSGGNPLCRSGKHNNIK